MSKKTKRFLSILMTFIMIMVSVPIPELKVHAGSGVWIGNTELTEDSIVMGSNHGSAILTSEGGKKILTFDDFDGVLASHEDAKIYTDTDITVKGSALVSTDELYTSAFKIGSGATVTIDKDAQLNLNSEYYTVYSVTGGKLKVYGSLNSICNSSNMDDSIHVDTIELYDGCDVYALNNGYNGAAIQAGNGGITVYGGKLEARIKQNPAGGDQTYVRYSTAIGANGGNIDIKGGTVNAFAGDKESVAIGTAVTDQSGSIIISGGTVYAEAAGQDSVAIGGAKAKFGKLEITGGDITAKGTKSAIAGVKDGITIASSMYWKNPTVAPDVSDGIKGVVDTDGQSVTEIHLIKPESYQLWVGNTEVNSENKDKIPGIVGGEASYDPESKTLTFKGDVTGVDELYNSYLGKTYIYAAYDLTIEGDAAFDDENAEYGIIAGGTDAFLTVNGNISVKAENAVLEASRDITITGTVDATNTNKNASHAVYAQKLIIEDGDLNVSGAQDHNYLVYTTQDITLNGGSLSVNNLAKDNGPEDSMAIFCSGNMGINGGILWADNECDNTVCVDGDLKVNGGQVVLNGKNGVKETLTVGKDINIYGGKVNVTSDNNNGISCQNMNIESAVVSVKAKNSGISCGQKFNMNSGVLEAEAETLDPLLATGGITLKEGEVSVTQPTGGKVSDDGMYISESDGTTAVKKIRLDGAITYPVWIGETQVTEENKNGIPVEGGTVSYNELSRTLTFNGDVTGISTSYENAGVKYKIYSMDVLGLTIKGKASIKDTDAHTGIYVYGSKLTIDGDIDVYGKDAAVLAVNGEICVNGKLTAESNGSDSTVKCPGNITLDGEGLFVKNGSTNPAVSTSKKLILNSGVLEAESASKAVEAGEKIVLAEGYETVFPEGGNVSDDGKTIDVWDEGVHHRVPAKKVRLEKREHYGVYVGGKEIIDQTKDNVEGLKSGSASFNKATRTLTFKNAVIEDFLGEYETAIYSPDPLIIEGDVEINVSDKTNYAIRSEGNLTINGKVTVASDKYGIYAEDADLLVNGEIIANSEKAGVSAKNITVDGGSLSANAAYVISTAVVATEKVILKGGSLTATNSGEQKANGIDAKEVELIDGKMLIQKENKDGYGICAPDGVYVRGGELDIICENESSKGIKNSYLFIEGGKVNIKVSGLSSAGIVNDGVSIQMQGGSLSVSSEFGNAIRCGKFNLFGGKVYAESDKSAALNCANLDMKSGEFVAWCKAEEVVGAIKSTAGIDLSGEVEIVEPAGGEAKQLNSGDPYTIVDTDNKPANKVKLYAPTKYNVWVGSTQVTDQNQDNIPNVTGGTISYDDETKTLIVSGNVTGVNGLDVHKAQIYADQDLTVRGNITLENDAADHGIYVAGVLRLEGDIKAAGKLYGFTADDGITISGNIVAKADSANAESGIFGNDYIVLEAGSIDAAANGKSGAAALLTGKLILNSGEVNAYSDLGAAVNVVELKADKPGVRICAHASANTGMICSDLEIENGDIYVEAKDDAIKTVTFKMSGGSLEAVSEDAKAINASTGITIDDEKVEITSPEDGSVSSDGKTIVDKNGDPAKGVIIEQKGVKYIVSFNMCEHGAAITAQKVLSGNTVVKPADPTETGFTFRGWYTEKEYVNLYDFSTPVSSNFILYAKWTDNAPSELVSISINKAPDKTVYLVGESFDPAGMVVSANYADSKDNRIVEDYTYTPTGALVSGNTVIIVSYTEGGITKTASQNIVVKDSIIPGPDEDADVWNLFEETDRTFDIYAISAGAEIPNTNVKSAKFYNATLNGNTIDVELKAGVNRKTAAKPANTVLEFRLASGETVEYVMPVQYVKPAFKLSSTSATIKNGAATVIKTQLLYKTKGGNFEPYDLSAAEVKYGSMDVSGDMDGNISFVASAAMSGIKLSVKEEEWESAVELKFKVKAVSNDVLNVDMGSLKTVVLNTNSADQKYTFDLILNGKDVTPADNIEISCKASGIASVNAAGKLEISLPATAPKAGNYTVTLAKGKAKAKVKVKISAKTLSDAITMKIQSKYDVVTGQKMVVVPVFKDAGMEILDVSSTTADITAELNDGGNIEIEYTGSALNAKNLKMGDIALKLELDGVADPVSVTLKNVKAKKSTPKVKASVVNISAAAAGEVKGSVNIISTYKDGSGKYHLIAPVSVEIVSQKKAIAEKNAADMTEIDIKSMDAKSGSVKVKLTYPGGVTKNVTIKVKKK